MKSGYNKFLLILLYAYVFIAPFEDLLEFLYGIDTIFKPYRVVGIFLLIFGFFYKFPKRPLILFPADRLLIFYFAYAVAYTIFLSAVGVRINMGAFLNMAIQISFMILIHLTIKRIDVTYKQFHNLMLALSLGIIVNAIFIVIDFYFLSISTREKGMSDNSNYAAMSMAFASQYFVYRIIRNRFEIFNLSNLLYLGVLAYLFLAVLATGSRTGFIIFAFAAGLLIAFLTNWSTKLRLIPFAVVVGGFLLVNTGFVELTQKSATFNRLTTATEDVRVPLFKAGVNALEDSWFMGIGIAQMIDGKTFAKYIAPVDPKFLAEVESRGKGLGLHNLYLEVAVEAGIIGLVTFLFWLFFIFKHQVTMLRYEPRRGEHTLLLILFIAVLITGVTGKGLLGALFWMMYTLSSKYYIETEYDLSDPNNPVPIKKT